MEPLASQAIRARLAALPQWRRAGGRLRRKFSFDDFAQALRFVNRVGRLAERRQHHPDIEIHYNQVILTLTTHDTGGLTERDFELAHAVSRQAGGPRPLGANPRGLRLSHER